MDTREKMRSIIEKMKKAEESYYRGEETMSNFAYDALFDELAALEKETSVILPDSPTQRTGAEVVKELPKEKHEFPALSLDKTKDYGKFTTAFLKGKLVTGCDEAVIMWKLDGSTLQCTYENGRLVKAMTRGNGEIGNVITHNAPFIKGLPMSIPFTGKLVVRGEAVMTYSEFSRINETLSEDEDDYKNPRNLATSTVQMLDSRKMRTREIQFKAFNLVDKEGNLIHRFDSRLAYLEAQGFAVVEHETVSVEVLEEQMKAWEEKASAYEIPVDGLVVAFNDASYAETLIGSGHHPHVLNGYAFKWADETAETTLREIEWSASRTGLLNPVAVFDPVELEGTTVSRASLHNVSYIRGLKLKVGDKISVYKANKIIPQVAENLSVVEEKRTEIPEFTTVCPCCGETAVFVNSENSDTVTAVCGNPLCNAKLVGQMAHFCERDCMNIDGLSKATLEKFIEAGFLHEFADLYHLDRYRDEIVSMPGFGEASYENIINSVNKSRKTNFVAFLHALGLPNVGKGQAKILSKAYHGDIEAFLASCSDGVDFTKLEGIGEVIANSIHQNIKRLLLSDGYGAETSVLGRLLDELTFEVEVETVGDALAGEIFVITGSLNHYPNRDALKEHIEQLGGKVSGSVSTKTSYLINNNSESTSGKNKKAIELMIPIITEDEFLQMLHLETLS